jgi:hypothetical protein
MRDGLPVSDIPGTTCFLNMSRRLLRDYLFSGMNQASIMDAGGA